jgi:hypothetical protein
VAPAGLGAITPGACTPGFGVEQLATSDPASMLQAT